MQELQRGLLPGTLVRARGERWRINVTRQGARVRQVVLDGVDDSNRHRRSVLLSPFDRIEAVAAARASFCRRNRALRAIAQHLMMERPRRGVWSAATASMTLLPWQLEPALAVVGGATRLLLADEVGLGKTVQAGLVLAELRERGLLERALILTPASVRAQWMDELSRRFGLPVTVLDLPALLELERSGPVGTNPWTRAPIVVASIDLVKRAEVCAAVEQLPLDALVVDEAHHLTPATDREKAVRRLACQAPWVILASATPHSGDAAAYRSLLSVGAVAGDPGAMLVFRRGHATVRLSVQRRTRVRRVPPTSEEARLQEGVLAYTRQLSRAPHGDTTGARLFASLLARRAASSPWAAHATLRRRHAALLSDSGAPAPVTPPLPWEETDTGDEAEPWLPSSGLADRRAEIAQVESLIAVAEHAGRCASKMAYVIRLIRRVGEPLIVFSEFRDTVEAYAARLAGVTTVTALHGGLDGAERQRRVELFLAGGAQVLVTTDVAGEGLNLQHGARTVITIEWPWNPLRLEQRIGRVHRLGQARDVHAVHLTARGSYEDSVVARVLQRAARAAQDLAAVSPVTEQHVAAAVLDEALPPVAGPDEPREAPGPHTVAIADRAGREAARLSRLRQLLAPRNWEPHGVESPGLERPEAGRRDSERRDVSPTVNDRKADPRLLPPGPVWTRPARGIPRLVVIVVELVEVSPSGESLASSLAAVTLSLRRSPTRDEWRPLCRALADDHTVRRAAVDALLPEPVDSWAGTRARLAALIRARQPGRRLVQASLFDIRAVRAVEQAGEIRETWDRWQSRILARLPGEGAATIASRTIAVIPLAGVPQ